MARSKARKMADGEMKLTRDGSSKLEANATGVDVTGTVTADGLTVVDGGSTVQSRDVNGYARLTQQNGSAQLGLFRSGSSAGGGYIGGNSNASFIVMNDSFTERMRVDSSGNVGIGASSLSDKLHVEGGGFRVKQGSSALRFNEYNNGAYLWLDGSNGDFTGGDYFNIAAVDNTRLSIGYAGGASFSLKSNGRVGIGTTSPAGTLDVNGNIVLSGDTEHNIQKLTTSLVTNAAVETTHVAGRNVDIYAYDDVNIRAGGSDHVAVHAGGVERMRINSTGDVGINGGNSDHAMLNIQSSGHGTSSKHGILVLNRSTHAGSSRRYIDHFQTNTQTSANKYLHIKTNIGMSDIMYRLHFFGYNYGTGKNMEAVACGYAYGANGTIISIHNHAIANLTPHTYKSSDNKVCIRLYVGSSAYYAGLRMDASFSNGTGYNHNFEVLGSTWTSSSSNQY